MYKVVFRSRSKRAFKKLDKKTQRIILGELERLVLDPFSHPNTSILVGVKQRAFRLRVGRWRVLYIVITKKNTLEVIDLFLRKGRSDYKKL